MLGRVKGIEPSSQAWEARILPLNHTRTELSELYSPSFARPQQLYFLKIGIYLALF